MKLPLIQTLVRRDASTSTPVTVLPHEIMILQDIFGEENVSEGEHVGAHEIDPGEEFSRLKAKYGEAQVEKVFGANQNLTLKKYLDDNAIDDETTENSKPGRGRPKRSDLVAADKQSGQSDKQDENA